MHTQQYICAFPTSVLKIYFGTPPHAPSSSHPCSNPKAATNKNKRMCHNESDLTGVFALLTFRGGEFCVQPAGPGYPAGSTVGQIALSGRGIFTEDYWYWLGLSVLFLYSIGFNILATVALQYLPRKHGVGVET